jgi:hypothetical protein
MYANENALSGLAFFAEYRVPQSAGAADIYLEDES